jgi:histidinol phosphatase-like enzyme
MLKDAEAKYNIDLSNSIMIGDRPTDIYAGKSVGCVGFQLLTGSHDDPLIESNMTFNPSWLIPDKTFNNLFEAAVYLRDSE